MNFSQHRICRPPTPSKVVQIWLKMRNVLNRKKNHVSDFSDLYFSSYGENSSKIDNFELKNNHITKTKNRKYLKINFSFIPAHSASVMQIWPLLKEKKLSMNWSNRLNKLAGDFTPPAVAASLDPHALGLKTLSSLVSVNAILCKKNSSVFCMHEVTCIKIK